MCANESAAYHHNCLVEARNEIEKVSGEAGRDLAALSLLCDRLVLTSGTFGVVAGLLHGGYGACATSHGADGNAWSLLVLARRLRQLTRVQVHPLVMGTMLQPLRPKRQLLLRPV